AAADTITAGILDHYAVTEPSSGQTGTDFSVTVTAQDQYDNTTTGDAVVTLSVVLASDTATAGGGTLSSALAPSLQLDTSSGSAIINDLQYTKAEEIIIVATGSVVSDAATTLPALNISADDAVKLQILLPGEVADPGSATGKTADLPDDQVAGVEFTVTVNAVDANWNVNTGATPLVDITSSDVFGVIPDSASLVLGTQTFNITLKTADVETITATDNAAVLTANQSANVTVDAADATKLQILLPGETADPGSPTGKTADLPDDQTMGVEFTVTVNAVDANWNVNTSETPLIDVTSSDGLAALPESANLVLGTQTFDITLNTAGVQTITATDNASVLSPYESMLTTLFVSGTLTGVSVVPDSTALGEITNHTIALTTVNDIPASGKIQVDFP
ncbi:MAG: hypothetical protein KAT00_07175, partial [Planctomycetes bacterium]|nr:hypothetical protein [Planctomycetota bacterium]